MKNGGDFWFYGLLIATLASCGGTGKNTSKSQNDQILPENSFFQFKANVTGLNGSLVLLNLGQHEVTIQQNGITTFPVAWNHEAHYEIKVLQEPCDQRCTVDEPRGQITTTGTKTVSITCTPKTWDYPLVAADSVSPPNTPAQSPLVAMNKYGDMLLSWYQNNYFNLEAYQRTYENRKWSSLPTVTDHFSFAGYDVAHQSITFNDLSQGSVFWEQVDGANRKLFMGDYENSVLETPTALNNNINVSNLTANDYNPVVRSNALGEKIAVWAQEAGSSTRLYKAEYRNGNWTLPINIIDNINPDGSDVSSFDAAINDLGDIVVVWQQTNGTYERIYKSEYLNGIWTHPTSLSDNLSPNGSDAIQPKVAINNTGDVYVVWFQYDNDSTSRYQIFVAESHNGNWQVPSSLSDNISPDGRHSKYAEVTVNDSGKAEIASLYRENDSINVYQVGIQEKISGSGWTAPMILSNTSATENPTRPMMGMDAQGSVVVAWALQNTGNVYKAEYRHGTWNLASLVSPVNFLVADYDYPSVAVNNCRATLAWSQKNTAGVSQIYVAQYH